MPLPVDKQQDFQDLAFKGVKGCQKLEKMVTFFVQLVEEFIIYGSEDWPDVKDWLDSAHNTICRLRVVIKAFQRMSNLFGTTDLSTASQATDALILNVLVDNDEKIDESTSIVKHFIGMFGDGTFWLTGDSPSSFPDVKESVLQTNFLIDHLKNVDQSLSLCYSFNIP